jgi:hypothetical protein
MLDGKTYAFKPFRGALEVAVLARFANLKPEQPFSYFRKQFKRWFRKGQAKYNAIDKVYGF